MGVYFSNGLISVESDNWKARLGKLQSVLNLWKQRELSFLGRAMIVNVLGASRFCSWSPSFVAGVHLRWRAGGTGRRDTCFLWLGSGCGS